LKRLDPTSEEGYTAETIGAAHEVFTDCVHDIQGAIDFLEERGVEGIYLVGHSTGCQKAVYYLSQRPSKSVKRAVLLCPLSDYADFKANDTPAAQAKALNAATKLVEQGKPHDLLPKSVWPDLHDAQRFLSLYTPDSEEEIFTYAQPDKEPTTLQAVTIPLHIMLAGDDEYADRPAAKIGQWFKDVLPKDKVSVTVIAGATHNLSGRGEEVRKQLKLAKSRLDGTKANDII